MHGEKEWFDIDDEVDAIAHVVIALEDARYGSDEERSNAIYDAISNLRNITHVETHIDVIENIVECRHCGEAEHRREMYRSEEYYYCDEDCEAEYQAKQESAV